MPPSIVRLSKGLVSFDLANYLWGINTFNHHSWCIKSPGGLAVTSAKGSSQDEVVKTGDRGSGLWVHVVLVLVCQTRQMPWGQLSYQTWPALLLCVKCLYGLRTSQGFAGSHNWPLSTASSEFTPSSFTHPAGCLQPLYKDSGRGAADI